MKLPDGKDRSGAAVKVEPPVFFVALIGAGWFLGRFVPLPVPGGPLRIVIGAAAAVTALTLFAWSVGLFLRSGQHPAPWTRTPSLIGAGPYRFTRNPMYLAMTVLHAAIGILAGNAWIAAGSLVALSIVHVLAVLPEEAYLAARFGADYARYRQRVRRYI